MAALCGSMLSGCPVIAGDQAAARDRRLVLGQRPHGAGTTAARGARGCGAEAARRSDGGGAGEGGAHQVAAGDRAGEALGVTDDLVLTFRLVLCHSATPR